MIYTPENIQKLKPGEVFVFGSNLAGAHGSGAAKIARVSFGAEIGVGRGLTGQCYALPTKDAAIVTLPIQYIWQEINTFVWCAMKNLNHTFLVTEVGCGLAGYTPAEVAIGFKKSLPLSRNIILPESFVDAILYA